MSIVRRLFGGLFRGGLRGRSKEARARWDTIREAYQGRVRGMLLQGIADTLHCSTADDPPEDRALRRQATANTVYADALYEIMVTGVTPPFEPHRELLKWARNTAEEVLEEWLERLDEDETAAIENRRRLAEGVLETLHRAAADEVLQKAATARVENDSAARAA